MLVMTVDGQRPRWPGTASGQLLLTVALWRPRWGTFTHHRSGGCARAGQHVCHCHQELWLLVVLQLLLVANCINTSMSWSCVPAPALSLLVLITF